MLLDALNEVNWLAVVVAAALYYVLGFAWFLPQALGTPWMRAMGMDPNAGPPSMNPIAFVVPAIAYLVAALATSLLVDALGYTSLGDGLALGLVVGVGYAVTTTAVTANYEPGKPQPWIWFLITGAYHLVGLVIVAVVVTLWQ
jgi:hypothetical protein